MTSPDAQYLPADRAAPPTATLGCVSYLNARPLIDGLDGHDASPVRFDVPARLLEMLESRQVDIALCPVIDYYRSASPLMIVPVGGICSQGPTLTVRLFSRVPVREVQAVHADTDSHTSVALLQVLLDACHGLRPRIIDYQAAGGSVSAGAGAQLPQSMLLIGDKVVTDSPLAVTYPHQLDLGQAWHELTGLPFVFAVWMAHEDADLGRWPSVLAQARQRNAGRIDEIVHRHATDHGWPIELARQYLGSILRYDIGPRELEAIERFGEMAAQRGLIARPRALKVFTEGG